MTVTVHSSSSSAHRPRIGIIDRDRCRHAHKCSFMCHQVTNHCDRLSHTLRFSRLCVQRKKSEEELEEERREVEERARYK